MMVTLAESGHPVFRATSPLSRGVLKSKGGGKLSILYCADQETITTVFRTITSVNQLSLHGAVAEICEEYESYHERTVRPVVGGQSSSSFVPSVIKTNVPLNNDDPTRKELLLQRYGERIAKLSQQDRLSKFYTDAGFLTTVEVGQCFMTKDTEEFTQFTDSVACREYTLPRDEDTSEPKGWIRGNTEIGPVLEVTTCCLQGQYGVENKIEPMNKDNSYSWVRISHGLNKLVTNLNNNEQETSEIQFEEYALKLNAGVFASRSKAKAKPQTLDFASSSTRTIPIGERTRTDVEPGKHSISDYSMSKKLINLLRHGGLPRDNGGAKEFWRIKDYLQNHFLYCHHWSDEKWKSSMAGGGQKKRFQYCSDSSGTILYLRALQGHSRRIPDGFFQYIYHIGCAINLHSIINSGQTVFFLPVDPMDKSHKDPDVIDLSVPRRAQYLHKAWKRHQDAVFLGRHQSCSEERIEVLHATLPAYCIPKAIKMETGEVIYEKVYASPRPPPKISLKHHWMKELGSEVARQPEGEVVRQAKSSPSSQPNPNPDHDRTERPVVCVLCPRSDHDEASTGRAGEEMAWPFYMARCWKLL